MPAVHVSWAAHVRSTRPSLYCFSMLGVLACTHTSLPPTPSPPPPRAPPTPSADLHGMGGLPPLVAQLAAGRPAALQAAAAHALGTAAQNNHQFQAQLLANHPEVLQLLLALAVRAAEPGGTAGATSGGAAVAATDEPAARAGTEVGLKALYALSAILRLNAGARAAFYGAGGVHTLQQLLGSAAAGQRARKKAAALLADLVHLDAPAMSAAAAAAAAATAPQQHAKQGAGAPAAALDFSAAVAAALQLLDVEAWPLQEADLDLQVRCVSALPRGTFHCRPARSSATLAGGGGLSRCCPCGARQATWSHFRMSLPDPSCFCHEPHALYLCRRCRKKRCWSSWRSWGTQPAALQAQPARLL